MQAGRLALLCVVGLSGCERSPIDGMDEGTPDLASRRPDTIPHAPYPIVLVHGFAGIADSSGLNYFYNVADALQKDGFQVFQPQLAQFNSSDVRGPQLISAVQQILALTGAAKVNVIAHSQGGLDARLLAQAMPDRIALIVTLSTPHHGALLADIVTGVVPGPLQSVTSAILAALGAPVDSGGLATTDTQAAFASMSTPGTSAFNARVPDQPGVTYYSIAGRSNNDPATSTCASSMEPPFLAKWDADVDPVDLPLIAAAGLLNLSASPSPPNDALVTVESAKWGTFLGCIPADHYDEICGGGQSPGAGNPFDCLTFYRDVAHFIVDHGG